MCSSPERNELLHNTWLGLLVFSFVTALFLFGLETTYQLLKNEFWPSDDKWDEYSFDLESKEYKDFIEMEAARLQRKQERERGGGQGAQSEGSMERKQRCGTGYDCRKATASGAAKEGLKFMGAAESISGWRRNPNLFRPLDSSPTNERVRRSNLRLNQIQHESIDRGEKGLYFYEPTSSSNQISTVPTFSLCTPVRRIKLEYTPAPVLASPFGSSSGSSVGSDSTLSQMSTIPTSPHYYHSRSSTPESSFPRVPSPGDSVFRRRPAHSIIKNTVDETDLWDGPFTVLSTTLQSWVELLLPQGSNTPAWTAVEDTMLSQDKAQTAGVEVRKDGTKLYMIDKIRGVKDRECTGELYLVHWKGWGCEDDTWEPRAGLPSDFVRDFEMRVKNWEEARKRMMTMRIKVEIPVKKAKGFLEI